MANNRGVSPSSFRDSANKAPISDPLLSRSLRSSVTEPLLMAAKKSDCSFKDGLRHGVGPGSNNGKRNQIHRHTRRGGTESSVGESIMNAGKIDDDYALGKMQHHFAALRKKLGEDASILRPTYNIDDETELMEPRIVAEPQDGSKWCVGWGADGLSSASLICQTLRRTCRQPLPAKFGVILIERRPRGTITSMNSRVRKRCRHSKTLWHGNASICKVVVPYIRLLRIPEQLLTLASCKIEFPSRIDRETLSTTPAKPRSYSSMER
ncbi:hypothetical protein OUZ56_014187 [Daphnia magna]|uniref:Uncharacterized protein n=1 Tax=Daphnia magna TaxID=35525 RepID=A0ABQ9Z821_9CRUS|nr:hypothetical protein OUZ56_014187 [Daphnia magna]